MCVSGVGEGRGRGCFTGLYCYWLPTVWAELIVPDKLSSDEEFGDGEILL